MTLTVRVRLMPCLGILGAVPPFPSTLIYIYIYIYIQFNTLRQVDVFIKEPSSYEIGVRNISNMQLCDISGFIHTHILIYLKNRCIQ